MCFMHVQALLANMAAMYGVYHGPEGLKAIAQRCHTMAAVVAEGARRAGHTVADTPFFDTVCIDVGDSAAMVSRASQAAINLRALDANRITVAVDETTTIADLDALLGVLNGGAGLSATDIAEGIDVAVPAALARESPYMTNDVFNKYHSEHDMLRCDVLRALRAVHAVGTVQVKRGRAVNGCGWCIRSMCITNAGAVR